MSGSLSDEMHWEGREGQGPAHFLRLLVTKSHKLGWIAAASDIKEPECDKSKDNTDGQASTNQKIK